MGLKQTNVWLVECTRCGRFFDGHDPRANYGPCPDTDWGIPVFVHCPTCVADYPDNEE
jgi:rubredoxin